MNGLSVGDGWIAYENVRMWKRGIRADCCRCGEAPAGDNRGQQSRATIPFSSTSWFSQLQIDVYVDEPETWENPTRSFEIHNIVWRLSKLLAVIIYICII